MTNQGIFERVDDFVKNNLAGQSFDKALPKLQGFVWELGDQIGMTGSDVLKVYLDIKSQM